MSLKVFHFSYEGMALGGLASVVAENEAQAREFLLKDEGPCKGPYRNLDLIDTKDFHPGVIYNWNGDY